MAEKIQAPSSKRDAYLARLREKHPDMEFADDEALYGQAMSDYDDYENQVGLYKKDSEALSEMFSKSPMAAAFLADMHGGKDPFVSLVRNFGMDIENVIDDPAMQEELAAANKEYLARVAKDKELNALYEANMDETLDLLRKWRDERGMTDEQVDALAAKIIDVSSDAIVGKITPEALEIFAKAMNYDADVANAGEEGRIAGRNDRITERLRKVEKGDGTMPLNGKPGGTGRQRREKNLFDLAGEAM